MTILKYQDIVMPEIVNKIRKLTGLTLGKMKPQFTESLHYKVIFIELCRVGNFSINN